MILFLDTSGKIGKIWLISENQFFKNEFETSNNLSIILFEEIEKILQKAKISKNQLTALAGFVGPGSFTGLRVGLAVLNGLSLALNVPLIKITQNEMKNLEKLPKIILKKYTKKEFEKSLVPFYGAPPKITPPKNNFNF